MVSLEQRLVAVVQDILKAFTTSGTMDLDRCLRISTAKAFLANPQRCKTTGCDSYGALVQKMVLSLLETSERKPLN